MKYALLKFKKERAQFVAAYLCAFGATTLFSWSEDDFFGITIYVVLSCNEEQINYLNEGELKNLVKQF